MTRDMTEKQFVNALSRRNYGPASFLGYVSLGLNPDIHVCRFHGGDRLRDQLAYLIAEEKRWTQKQAASPPPA